LIASAHEDEFAQLAGGLCHYRFDGPSDGRCILMIHGATVAGWEFDRLAPLLHTAGWRTLRPDLFGHGHSARPRARYAHGFFVQQLLDLLDVLNIRQPIPILGHSLGAALAARLIDLAPWRFRCAILGAPLVDYTASSPASRLLQWPLLGEALTHSYVVPMLIRRRTRNYRSIEDGRFVGKFTRQAWIPGYGRALLSMFRNRALSDQTDCYRTLGAHKHPVLILHGEHDAIVSIQQVQRILNFVPHAALRTIDDTGHAFMLTDPMRIAPVIIEFLNGYS
jgi:pimeloyl-ACP methyl ester carboxylesterase